MLKQLINSGIPFAVVVSYSKFISDSTFGGREYFVVMKEKDVPEDIEINKEENIKPKKTKKDEVKEKPFDEGLSQIDLSEDDTEYFKIISEDIFERVHHTEDGRVYELKQNSFKTYNNII